MTQSKRCTSGSRIRGISDKDDPCGRLLEVLVDPKTKRPVYVCPHCDQLPRTRS